MLVYLQIIATEADRARFEEIYLAYRGLMFHVAKNILHNDQDAEDTVHQSFVKLAEHLDRIPDRHSAWDVYRGGFYGAGACQF